MDLDFSESISQYRANAALERAEVAQLAATMWAGFTRNEKTIVRIGMFPAEKMAEAEQQITHITDGGPVARRGPDGLREGRRGDARMTDHPRLWSGDRFTHKGYIFRYTCEHDQDMREPWKAHDGHGIISEWTTRGKMPGERILATDRTRFMYYDIAATTKLAKKDGWGIRRPDATGHTTEDYAPLPGESKRAYTARAVEADFERMRDWCQDKWHWCYVSVEQLDEDGTPTGEREGVGGIDGDDQDEYLTATAYELADEILARVEVDTPDVQLSEN